MYHCTWLILLTLFCSACGTADWQEPPRSSWALAAAERANYRRLEPVHARPYLSQSSDHHHCGITMFGAVDCLPIVP